MDEQLQVEPLQPSVQEAAVGILARAFRDNPLDRAVIGAGADLRLRSIVHGMRASLELAAGRGRALLGTRSGSPAGVLLALPPGSFPLPARGLLAHLRAILGQGLRVSARWGRVYRTLEAVHPVEPHWYLSLLGVDPSHRNRRVGSGLLRFWLEVVDREALPSYLETDREENVGFYEREGFAVQSELKIFETPIWCMRRAPLGRPS